MPVLFVAALCPSLLVGAEPRMRIPLVAKAPSIDGSLGGEWGAAACASAFVTTDGGWPSAQTTAYVMADAANVYFAFKCHAPGGFEAQSLPRNSLGIFGAEAVELFLRPDLGGATYYHLAFNPEGSCYAARCETDAKAFNCAGRDESWDAGVEFKTGISSDGWTVEARLPLRSLPSRGGTWGMNFCRDRKGKLVFDEGCSSWTGQGNFNAPALFGQGTFAADGKPSWELERLTPDEAELLFHKSAEDVSITANGETFTKEPKSGTPLSFKFPRELKGMVTLRVGAYVRTALAGDVASRLTITPQYYYCPKNLEELPVAIASLDTASHELRLFRDEASPPLRTLSATSAGASFDIAGLPPGRYVVKADGGDAASVFFIGRETSLPALPEGAKFALDGAGFTLDGRPFFPFMASDTPQAPPSLRACFNVNYGGFAVRGNAPARGSCGLPGGKREDGRFYYPLGPEEEVRDMVRRAVVGGGVLCRNLRYEAQIALFRRTVDGLFPLSQTEEYEGLYKFIKQVSPETLVSIHRDVGAEGVTDESDIEGYARCCDILELSFWSSSMGKNLVRHLSRDLRAVRSRIGGRKPLLLWIGASIPKASARTAETIRCGVYLAMMNQVDGVIFHMGHGGIPLDMTRLWSVFGGLAVEAEFLCPLLRAADVQEGLRFAADNPAVECRTKEIDGKLYVVAVNTGGACETVKFSVKGGGKSRAAVLFESRTLPLDDGAFFDTFTGYEPHVYELGTILK